MADDTHRWGRGDDHRHGYGYEDDDRHARGDVDRAMRASRRRLEQAGDYNPELLDDMRRFAGEGRGRRDTAYTPDTRGYAGERHARAGHDRGGRGAWDRSTDEASSWFGDGDADRRRTMDRTSTGTGAWTSSESRDWSRDRGWSAADGHRGRGPRGYARSDERIREDVSDRLTEDRYVDASDIEVAVSGCEVTLTGTVDTRAAKRRAEDIAESVSGVRHVQNNLRVQPPAYTGSSTAGGASAMAGLGSGGTPATSGLGSTDSTATARTVGSDTTGHRR